MSIDSSLKTSGSLNQHRNVLTRAERIAKLKEQGRFSPETVKPIGLPKVANRKVGGGKKVTKKEGTADAAAPAAAADKKAGKK